MKIFIDAEPAEIAALIAALQGRRGADGNLEERMQRIMNTTFSRDENVQPTSEAPICCT